MLQTKIYPTEVPQKLILLSISDSLKKEGFLEGDIVYTMKGAGAEVKNGGYVWSALSAILCYERNGILKAPKGKNIVLQDERPDFVIWNDLMISERHRDKYIFGTYIDGDFNELIGEKVAIIHSFNTKVQINGIDYAVVKKENLIFKQ